MVLLIKLEALLGRPRRLAERVSAEPLGEKLSIDRERRAIAEYFAKHWTRAKRVVCLRRREAAGRKPFRYHLRPVSTVAGEAGAGASVGLICEYDEGTRVLEAVKWEVVAPMPLSEKERVFAGEIHVADFNYGVTYSDTPAVKFLMALPEEADDLSVPLAKWREYLAWRQTLAEEKAKVRYEFSEIEVLANRKAVRFFLKEEQGLEQLRGRFANEELKVLPLTANATRRSLQGAFESIRAEGRHEDRPRGRTRALTTGDQGGTNAVSRGTPERLSLVLKFDDNWEGDLANLAEGVLQLAMEGELSTLDVQIQGLARLSDGRAVNPRLRTWLFDAGKAPAIAAEKLAWSPDTARRLNPEQRSAVERALAMEDLLLLWGPPGTGKTTVIAELCSQYVRRGMRVLVSSQANLAVTQALERLPPLPHLRPIFISTVRRRENLPQARDFIGNWLADVRAAVAAKASVEKAKMDGAQVGARGAKAEGKEKNAERGEGAESGMREAGSPWAGLLAGWEKRLAEITPEDLAGSVAETYLRCANVIGATCNETGKPDFITSASINPRFDLAIVDEVSKATPPEMLLPMLMGQRVMLVGDHRQLPPMFRDVTFEEARENQDIPEEAVGQYREMVTASLFERYFAEAPASVRQGLRRQYRMHPQIMAAVNHFYADQPLLAGDAGTDLGREKQHGLNLRSARGRAWLQGNQHLIWIDTSLDGAGQPVRDATQGTSRKNAVEAEVCAALVRDIFAQDRRGDLEVAVISFYRAQIGLLRERFRAAGIGRDDGFDVNRDINTVDQFQGSERDVVIVSLVRTGPRLTGEFVRDFRRINVAFSRAKKLLIVLAGRETFASAEVEVPGASAGTTEVGRVYAKIYELARAQGAAFTAGDILGVGTRGVGENVGIRQPRMDTKGHE